MTIRQLYLYLFSFIGLLITVIGAVQIVDLGLKVFVFQGADRYDYYPPVIEPSEGVDAREDQAAYEAEIKVFNEREVVRQRQRQLSTAIAMIAVGVPLYLYHWRTIARENVDGKRKR